MNKILEFLEAGKLLRNDWGDGRETACLYSAIVLGAKSTDNCPSDVMPQWMADLTPWIDDAGTVENWRGFVVRYAHAQEKWSVLTDAQWTRISQLFRAECVRFALEKSAAVVPVGATYWPAVKAACTNVCESLLRGDEPTEGERAAAKAAASAARSATARAAASATASATARATAMVAASATARATARATEWAAEWAAARATARATEWAAEWAAASAAADHLINHLLCLIEDALDTAADERNP